MGGQAHRAQRDRMLEVNRYFSTPKQPWLARLMRNTEYGVDDWIGMVAKEKTILNDELRAVL